MGVATPGGMIDRTGSTMVVGGGSSFPLPHLAPNKEMGGEVGMDGDRQHMERLQLMDTALQALPGRTLREYFVPVVGLKKNLILRKHRTELNMGALLLAIANAKKKSVEDRGEKEEQVTEEKRFTRSPSPAAEGSPFQLSSAAAQNANRESGEQQLTEALRRLAKSVVDAGTELHPSSGGAMPLDVDMFVDALRDKCEAISYEGGEVLCYPHEPPESMFVYILLRGDATITHFQPQLQRVTISSENRPSFFTSGKESVLLAGSGVLLESSKGGLGGAGVIVRGGDGVSAAMSAMSAGETMAGGDGPGAGPGGAGNNENEMMGVGHHSAYSNLLKNLRAAMRYVGQPTLEVVRTEAIRAPNVVGASEALSMAPFISATVMGSRRGTTSIASTSMHGSSRLHGEHLDVIRIRLRDVHDVLVTCALRVPAALAASPPSLPLPFSSSSTATAAGKKDDRINREKMEEKKEKETKLAAVAAEGGEEAGGERKRAKKVQVIAPSSMPKKRKSKVLALGDTTASATTTAISPAPLKSPSTVGDFIQHARSHTLSLYYPQNEILLRQSWLLQDTQPQTIRHLIAHMTPRTYLPGDILACPHGSSTRELCFLRRGEVCIVEPPPKLEGWGGGSPFQGGIEFSLGQGGHRRHGRSPTTSSSESHGTSAGGSDEDGDEEREKNDRGARRHHSRSRGGSGEGTGPSMSRENGEGYRSFSRKHASKRSPCTCDRRAFGSVVDIIYPGSSFGELSVLFGEPRAYPLVARTVCDVWCLAYRDFSLAMQRDDALRDTLVQKAAALRVKWLAEQRFTPQLTKHLRESCEMFRPFPDIVLRLIQERIEPVVYSPGELITSVADKCKEMIFIMQGRVESLVKGLARYSAGHVLGASCLVGHRWPLALSAKTMVEGWRLSRDQLLEALHKADILRAHSGEHTTLRMQYMWQIFRPPFPEFSNESAEDRNQMPIVPPAPGGTSYPEYGIRVSDILLRALCVVFKGYVKWEDISYGSANGGKTYNRERLARRHVIERLQQLIHSSSSEGNGSEGGGGSGGSRRSPSAGRGGGGRSSSPAGTALHTALQQQAGAAERRSNSALGHQSPSTSVAKSTSFQGAGSAARFGGAAAPLSTSRGRGLKNDQKKKGKKLDKDKDSLRRKVLGEDAKDVGGEGMTVIKHQYKRRKKTAGNCPFLVDDDAAERPFHISVDRRPPLDALSLKKNPSAYDQEYLDKMRHKPLLDSCFSVQDPKCTSRLRHLMYVPARLRKLENFFQERDEICMHHSGRGAPPDGGEGSGGPSSSALFQTVGGGIESEYLSKGGGRGGGYDSSSTIWGGGGGIGQSVGGRTTSPRGAASGASVRGATGGGDGTDGAGLLLGSTFRGLLVRGRGGVGGGTPSHFPSSADPLFDPSYSSGYYGPGGLAMLPEISPVHIFLKGEKPKVELSLQEAISIGLVLRLPSINGIESCVPVVDPDVCIGLPSHRPRRYQMAITPNDRHHKHCFQFAASELEEDRIDQRKRRGGASGWGAVRFGCEGTDSVSSTHSAAGGRKKDSSSRRRPSSCKNASSGGRRRSGGGGGGRRRSSSARSGSHPGRNGGGGGGATSGGRGGDSTGEDRDEDGNDRGSSSRDCRVDEEQQQFLTETLLSMWRANLFHYQSEMIGDGRRGGGGGGRTSMKPSSHVAGGQKKMDDRRSPTPMLRSPPRAVNEVLSVTRQESQPGESTSFYSPSPACSTTARLSMDHIGGGRGREGLEETGENPLRSGREESVTREGRKVSPKRVSNFSEEEGEEDQWVPSASRESSFSRPRPPGMVHLLPYPSTGMRQPTQGGGGSSGSGGGHEMLFVSEGDRYCMAEQTLAILQRHPQKALQLLLMRFGDAVGIGTMGLGGGAGGGATGSGSAAGWTRTFAALSEPSAVSFSFPRAERMESITSFNRNRSPPGSPFWRKGAKGRCGGGGSGGEGGNEIITMVDKLKGLSGWPTEPPPGSRSGTFCSRKGGVADLLLPGMIAEVEETGTKILTETTTPMASASQPAAPFYSGEKAEQEGERDRIPPCSTSSIAVIPPLGAWKDRRGKEAAAEEEEVAVEIVEGGRQESVRNKWKRAMAAKVLKHAQRLDGGGTSQVASSPLSSPSHGSGGGGKHWEDKGVPLEEHGGAGGATKGEDRGYSTMTRGSEGGGGFAFSSFTRFGDGEEHEKVRLMRISRSGHPPLEFLVLDANGMLQLSTGEEDANFPRGSVAVVGDGRENMLGIPPTPRSPGQKAAAASTTSTSGGGGGALTQEARPALNRPSAVSGSPLFTQKGHNAESAGRLILPRSSFSVAVANANLLSGKRRNTVAVGVGIPGGGGASPAGNITSVGWLSSPSSAAVVSPIDRFFAEKRRFLYVDGFGVLNTPEDYQGSSVVCFGRKWMTGGGALGGGLGLRGSLVGPTSPFHGAGGELRPSSSFVEGPGDPLAGTLNAKGAGRFASSNLSTPVDADGTRGGRRSGSLLNADGSKMLESGVAPVWIDDGTPEKFVIPTVEEAEECMERMQRDVDGLNAVAASLARERERLRFLQQSRGGAQRHEEIQKSLATPSMEEVELMDLWKQEHESVVRDHMRLAQIPRALVKHSGANYLDDAIREVNQYVPPVEPQTHKTVLAWHDQLETHTVWDELGHVSKIALQASPVVNIDGASGGANDGTSSCSSFLTPGINLNAPPLPSALRGSLKKKPIPSRDEDGGGSLRLLSGVGGDEGEMSAPPPDLTGPGWEKTSDSKRVLATIGTRQIARGSAVCMGRGTASGGGDFQDTVRSAFDSPSTSVFPAARPLRTPARHMTPQAYEAWVKEREAFLERYVKLAEK